MILDNDTYTYQYVFFFISSPSFSLFVLSLHTNSLQMPSDVP
jgi:hypothetical protein